MTAIERRVCLFCVVVVAALVTLPRPGFGADLTDGLLAYYRLDGNAEDSSGNGYHGVVSGGLTWVPGLRGQGARFEGAMDEHIRIDVLPQLERSLTISAFISPDELLFGDRNPLVTSGFDDDDDEPYGLWVGDSRMTLSLRGVGGSRIDCREPIRLRDGVYFHIASVYDFDARRIRMYVDGRFIGECDFASEIEPQTEPVYFGSSFPGNDHYLKGTLDEVAIWNRALSDQEVEQIAEILPGGVSDCAEELRVWEKLLPPNPTEGQAFGTPELHGDWLFLSAPFQSGPGSYSGTVYVYGRQGYTWEERGILPYPPGLDDIAWFGDDFASSEDTLIVTAPRTDAGALRSGTVFVYREIDGNWQYESQVQPEGVRPVDETFGNSAALMGDVLAVGTLLDTAYVFRWDGADWVQERQFIGGERFGRSVALADENTLIVGADADDEAEVNGGAVHVLQFDGMGWVEEQKLFVSDIANNHRLGHSVAVSGDWLVASAPFADIDGDTTGAV